MILRPRNAVFLSLVILLMFAGVIFAQRSSPFPEASYIAANAQDFGEFKPRFIALADEKGAEYAFEILKRANLPEGIDLHLLAHSVGDILYEQEGIGGMAICTDDFRNACSHSIVIGALLEHGEDILPQVHEACSRAPGATNAYDMCFHGFGHGVFTYFDDDLKKAFAYCEKTGTPEHDHREYIACAGGAIMELMGDGGHNPQDLEEARARYLTGPLEPCMSNVEPEALKRICLVYLTPWLWESAGLTRSDPAESSFAPAFAYCDTIPASKKMLRNACFGGFGKEFTVLAADRDLRTVDSLNDTQLRQIGTWCNEARASDGIRACVAVAVDSLLWGGANDPQIAFNFCAILSGDAADTCLKRLGRDIQQFFTDTIRREKLCLQLPEKYQPACNT
jgi:hypothetical protein